MSGGMAGLANSHGELMNAVYRRQRWIYDASRKYFLFGRDHLIAHLDPPEGGRVLEIGCGTGRNLVKVARAYPTARVFGLDISDEMLKSAAASIWKADLVDRVRIAQGDALSFDPNATFGIASFDRVFFSYTLSMIPAWADAAAHAARMLAGGGELHIADFGQCEELNGSIKALLFLWLRQFHVFPRNDLAAELQDIAGQRGGSMQFARGYRGYSWHLSLRAPA